MSKEAPAPETPRKTIRESVRESLSDLGNRTRENVIEHFAKQEAEKRAGAMIAGLDRLTTLERDLQKIKPTPVGFNAEGEPVFGVVEGSQGNSGAIFSKQQIEDRAKLSKQIEKLVKAINNADENNDFGELFNLTKGG